MTDTTDAKQPDNTAQPATSTESAPPAVTPAPAAAATQGHAWTIQAGVIRLGRKHPLRASALLGVAALVLGAIAYLLLPWMPFGPTGLDLAQQRERWGWVRAILPVLCALAGAAVVPHRAVVVPAVLSALTFLAVGINHLTSMSSIIVRILTYGAHLTSIALVLGVAAVVWADRDARKEHGQSVDRRVLAGVGVTVALAFGLSFGSSILTWLGEAVTQGESKAISLVQTSPVPGLFSFGTWKARAESAQSAAGDYRWSARKVDDDTYLVSYLATKGEQEGRGMFWQARLSDQTVRYVNNDELLSVKFGLSSGRDDVPFELSIPDDVMDTRKNGDIVASFSGTIINHTGKTLIKAKLSCAMVVIFGQRKAIRIESGTISSWQGDYSTTRLRPSVNRSHPWRNNETRSFVAKTKDAIDALYREYDATSARVELGIDVADPIDYEYSGVISTQPVSWSKVRTAK